MSRGTRLSILGLYNYNNRLFNSMHWPEGFTTPEQETVITNILAECAELECLFPDYNTMYGMIGAWSAIENPVWTRIYKASKLEYNPIENYNRTEIETISDDRTEQHSGKDSVQNSGTDNSSETGNVSGSNEVTNSVTGYDSNSYVGHDKSNSLSSGNNSSSGSVTYGRKEETTHGEKIEHNSDVTRENHTTGNIGVTTSQQMLEQEYNIAALLNVSKMIVESFKNRFCLLVY